MFRRFSKINIIRHSQHSSNKITVKIRRKYKNPKQAPDSLVFNLEFERLIAFMIVRNNYSVKISFNDTSSFFRLLNVVWKRSLNTPSGIVNKYYKYYRYTFLSVRKNCVFHNPRTVRVPQHVDWAEKRLIEFVRISHRIHCESRDGGKVR